MSELSDDLRDQTEVKGYIESGRTGPYVEKHQAVKN